MIDKWLNGRLGSSVTAIIEPNRVEICNPVTGETAYAKAPFSCGHLRVSEYDLLEDAFVRAFSKLKIRSWPFPLEVVVSAPGWALHSVERRAIHYALDCAGAKKIIFSDAQQNCEEQEAARERYVQKANEKR